jgi:hypothetical protein
MTALNRTLSRHSPNDESNRQAVFGSVHSTCLSALVTDWAIEAGYHPSIA